jgi:serine/threonine protein kinase
MDTRRPHDFGRLSPTQAWRVDAVCLRFEAELRDGYAPRIEEVVAQADPLQRVALIRELIALEVEVRRDRGERPDPREYRARFPDHDTGIAVVFAPESATSFGRESSPTDPSATRPPTGVSPSHVGPYKLLRQIGEGGMGVVYMAEQESPIRRRVALKIIRPGLDTAQVVARFEAERQALALMNHPDIATVHDAGTTDTGQHYFVMELVDGLPITDYCDQNRLTLAERLELFIRVCHAVQHAHLKGIIHRDLKPSNILVTLHDGRPVPKVIDFGLAKAIDQRLTERTMFTQFGQVIGTLEYMSPEQAEMGAHNIDTRSDIYALGVVLYELLTGSTPLQRNTVRQAAYSEILRRIREDEAPRPSNRLCESGDELVTIAARRQTEPARLAKLVRGELDWIVMRAVEKDRTRRYETAGAMARDVERFLSHEPVEAGPPSATYRLRKYARKHRGAFVMAGAFAGLLLLAAAANTRQAYLATKARNEAEQAYEQSRVNEAKAREQEAQARDAAAESNGVLKFFQDQMLSATRPEGQDGGLGKDVTIRKAVDAAEPKIAASFRDQPTIEASIRDALGETYASLGEPALAIRQFERALKLRTTKLGPDHPDTLISRNNLGATYRIAGRTAEAIALHQETLRLRTARLGPDHSDTLISRNNLATAYRAAGRTAEATALHQETLRLMMARLGPDDPRTLTSRCNLASACRDAGRTAEAIALHEETLRLRTAKLGPDHPHTLASRNDVAAVYRDAGRTAEAIALHQETLRLETSKLGPDHPLTLTTRNNLASAYNAAGRTAEAIALDVETLKLRTTKLGPDHPKTLISRLNLAQDYIAAGRTAEAIALHQETLKLGTTKLGPDHPFTLTSRDSLGAAYRIAGRTAEAIALHEETLKLRTMKLGAEHPDTLGSCNNLARAYEDAGLFAKAEPILRRCLTIRERALPDDWMTFNTRSQLGGSLLGQKKCAEAEPLVVSGYEGLKAREAKIPAPARGLTEAAARVVRLYEAWGKPELAAAWKAKLGLAELPADPGSSGGTGLSIAGCPKGPTGQPR